MKYLPIYIICHKNDFFLTKILISSIRYYYPETEINLIKDLLHGQFSTITLEKYFRVNTVKLKKDYFGWTSAKIFLLLSKLSRDKKFLLLDSDTVFIGKVLDKISPFVENYDFIVSPEYKDQPGSNNFSHTYYDFDWFNKRYPTLKFPGYTFNTGNIVITTGVLNKSDVVKYFDQSRFPYWTSLGIQVLPTLDQSLLNVLLPIKKSLGLIKIKRVIFMWWYREEEVKKLTLDEVKIGKYPVIIHWAGDVKHPYLLSKKRADILLYFQKKYYENIPFGKIKFYSHFVVERIKHFFSQSKPA